MITAKTREAFDKFAEETVRAVLVNEGADAVYREIGLKEHAFTKIEPEVFQMNFLALRLAICCIAWDEQCLESEITNQDLRRALLKQAMNAFTSEKDLPAAAAFSEYYTAPAVEEERMPVIAAAKKFIQRLELESVLKDEAGQWRLNPALILLVEVLDSLRSAYSAAVDDFIVIKLAAGEL